MYYRLKAFSIHLIISILVALLVLGLVFFIWYPGELATAVGVTQIFLIMLLVDVTLGPLLTLLVYKKGKKSLKFDLAVIGCLQFGAMFFGLHTVFEARPVWLVFTVDRFELVRVLDLDTRKADKVAPEYRSPSLRGPRWVAALPPDDPQFRSDIMMESVMGGLDLQQRPYLYHPLSSVSENIRNKALPLEQLDQFNSADKVKSTLASWPQADAWLPLKAATKSMVVLVNRESSEVVAVVNLAPWA